VTPAYRWLTTTVVLLAVAAGLGAALSWRTYGDRADARTREARYGAVLAAADAEVTAFVNLRYDHASQSVAAVARGATGNFRDHYVSSAATVMRVLERNHSVMTGRVVWSGVSELSGSRATVIAATSGTVSNVRTSGNHRARDFRFRVSLVRRAGRWLTSDIEFVGEGR
jgi:Mce-associated membrane protein